MVTTIVTKLEKQNIASIKSEILTEQYNFIKIEPELIKYDDKIPSDQPQYLEYVIMDCQHQLG